MDEVDWRRRLRKLLSLGISDLSGMSDVPTRMFAPDLCGGPQRIADFEEEEYQGRAYALYYYDGRWFTVHTNFGSCSGCDDWMDQSDEVHMAILNGLVDEVEPMEHVWQIKCSYGEHPGWVAALLEVMRTHGCVDRFEEQRAAQRA